MKNSSNYTFFFQGDSGGPIVTTDKRTLIGVVSGLVGGCGSGGEGIFTKVSTYISFINEEMRGSNNNPGLVYQ